jgi:hypothetical protein
VQKGWRQPRTLFLEKRKNRHLKERRQKGEKTKKYGIIAKEILEKTASWLDKMQH